MFAVPLFLDLLEVRGFCSILVYRVPRLKMLSCPIPLSLKLSQGNMKQAKPAKYAKSTEAYFQQLAFFQKVRKALRGTSPT